MRNAAGPGTQIDTYQPLTGRMHYDNNIYGVSQEVVQNNMYYTREEIMALINNIKKDIQDNYYTKEEVNNIINELISKQQQVDAKQNNEIEQRLSLIQEISNKQLS